MAAKRIELHELLVRAGCPTSSVSGSMALSSRQHFVHEQLNYEASCR